jgi:hypothetical protein
MKYLKTFEHINGKYWLIPTEQRRYLIALTKIGCNDDEWFNLNFSGFGDYIYIAVFNNNWEWEDYYSDLYDKKGYTYMGAVEIEDFELDQLKYNL